MEHCDWLYMERNPWETCAWENWEIYSSILNNLSCIMSFPCFCIQSPKLLAHSHWNLTFTCIFHWIPLCDTRVMKWWWYLMLTQVLVYASCKTIGGRSLWLTSFQTRKLSWRKVSDLSWIIGLANSQPRFMYSHVPKLSIWVDFEDIIQEGALSSSLFLIPFFSMLVPAQLSYSECSLSPF